MLPGCKTPTINQLTRSEHSVWVWVCVGVGVGVCGWVEDTYGTVAHRGRDVQVFVNTELTD